jgi:plasmid stabilization system protein ParE
MAFRVEISAKAERDAEAILEWLLTQHAGRAGIEWFLALDDAFASLAEFPERCPIAPEDARGFLSRCGSFFTAGNLMSIEFCSR